ncbi:hypothetical protein LCGC14_1759320, partial [marine sediment metagenome]
DGMRQRIAERFDLEGITTQVLDIPDSYAYRDAELIELIKEAYDWVKIPDSYESFHQGSVSAARW